MKLTPPPKQPSEILSLKSPPMLRQFQWKYTSYLLGATIASICLIGGAAVYMNQQNYEIFSTIATKYAPQLLSNIDRERDWLTSFLLMTSLGIITVYTMLGIRMTSKMIIPILLLQRHIKKLTRGDLGQREIRVRDTDEFQDLIDSYNYLYSSLKLQAKQDLKKLESLPVDPRNREAQNTIDEMISTRKAQLGLFEADHSGLADLRSEVFKGPQHSKSAS